MTTMQDYSKWSVPCLVKHFFEKITRPELRRYARENVAARLAPYHGHDLEEKRDGTKLAYWVKHLVEYSIDTDPSEPLQILMTELRKRLEKYEEEHGVIPF